jgi:hypothetical protein
MVKRKRKSIKKSGGYSLPIESLLDSTESPNEENFYELVFSGSSNSVRPVWMTVNPQPQEEYWILNQPYVKFATRLMSLTLPETPFHPNNTPYTDE